MRCETAAVLGIVSKRNNQVMLHTEVKLCLSSVWKKVFLELVR